MKQQIFKAKDVACQFVSDFNGSWANDVSGICECPCNEDFNCPAAFYFNGALNVYCINPACRAKSRSFKIPRGAIDTITQKWNE
jgi:hypothetical protein